MKRSTYTYQAAGIVPTTSGVRMKFVRHEWSEESTKSAVNSLFLVGAFEINAGTFVRAVIISISLLHRFRCKMHRNNVQFGQTTRAHLSPRRTRSNLYRFATHLLPWNTVRGQSVVVAVVFRGLRRINVGIVRDMCGHNNRYTYSICVHVLK